MDKGSGERQQPQEGKQDGDSGNDLGVDEALAVARALVARVVEVVARQASNDSRESELLGH